MHAMRQYAGNSRSNAMFNNLRKLELECVRLEMDCLQLAGAAGSPSLKLHYLRMAETWSTLAASGLEHGYRAQDWN
jgi:hypothetical protein